MPTSLALWLIAMLQAVPSNGVPGTGVPLTLAQSRAGRMSDLRYDLHFTIPAAATEPLAGRSTIRFQLKEASAPLPLDFSEPAQRITSLSVNGRTVEPHVVEGHVMLPAADLHAGSNEVRLAFLAGDASLNRNPDFLYTLFVPARAHLAFPCFDQPDLKARWTLALDVPSGWQVLANGAETAREESSGVVKVGFAETPPLPTYLFAFAAGKFSVETGERAGRTFRMFHRETDAAKVARNRDAIFDLHAASLAWLERYTGIPYPWGKFDFLLVPSFQFGGMEHAGAIFYNASGLLLDQSATQNQKLGRASVIAHETAHMWFGDLVTMRWFDDVWMKEVFANFMAAKIVNPSFPEINHELRFLYANYPAAYDVDRTRGTNAIRQHLDNLDEAGSLYGAIIYQKAPIVMRQLEGILGEESFRDGLREYLRDHAFANATWSDLIVLLDRRTPEDLAAWSRAWVEEAGRPTITTELQVSGGRITRLAFAQHDPVSARGLNWNQRLQVIVSSAQSHPRAARPAVGGRHGSAGGHRDAGSRLRAANRGRHWLRRFRARRHQPRVSARSPSRNPGPADSRRGVGHAVGTDARRARGAGRDHGARAARAAARRGRAQRRSNSWLRRPDVLDVSGDSGPRCRLAVARAAAARGTRSRDDGQPEVGVVLGAARYRPQPAGSRVARANLEKDGRGARPSARRA